MWLIEDTDDEEEEEEEENISKQNRSISLF